MITPKVRELLVAIESGDLEYYYSYRGHNLTRMTTSGLEMFGHKIIVNTSRSGLIKLSPLALTDAGRAALHPQAAIDP